MARLRAEGQGEREAPCRPTASGRRGPPGRSETQISARNRQDPFGHVDPTSKPCGGSSAVGAVPWRRVCPTRREGRHPIAAPRTGASPDRRGDAPCPTTAVPPPHREPPAADVGQAERREADRATSLPIIEPNRRDPFHADATLPEIDHIDRRTRSAQPFAKHRRSHSGRSARGPHRSTKTETGLPCSDAVSASCSPP